MIDLDTTLGQQFFDVTVGQAVAQIPAHRHHDHLRREPEPREPGLRRTYSTGATTHPPTLPEHGIRQRNRPSSRANALRKARSAQDGRGRPTCRRKTFTWWRSIRISAVLDASDRAKSAIQALS